MTTIVYDYDNWLMSAEGHAGAGEMGEDVICAAVSTLMQTLAINARLINALDLQIQEGDGDMCVCCYPDPQDAQRCRDAFDTIANGMRWLQADFPEFVTFILC